MPFDDAKPGALVHWRRGVAVTDSLTIAREFGRRHDNVLRTIDSLLADGTLNRLNVEAISYADEMNRPQRAFELDERAALIAMPFVGGRNSRIGQARLVDEFLAMRDRERTRSTDAWREVRGETRASFRLMGASLVHTRAAAGKATETHHYMNEARLVDYALTGRYGPLDRDTLSRSELALLDELAGQNAILIARGRSYPERKAELVALAARYRAAHGVRTLQ
ncbi:Rha family transcriptional regulator [Paraburkholderia hiiakae]|uniref:Rha family transcriptional regulator n=1 Tax=Paraburkholderia hiiakae TaxID=1081782 RepID=UPI001918DC5F|nr:Rha family transcriptional regulator [Paraburkholderia hiiakae]